MKRIRRKKKITGAQENKTSDAFFPGVQTKLAIGKADDSFEKEADHVADQVVNKGSESGSIQKKGTEEEQVQEKPANSITSIQKMGGAEEKEEPVQKMGEQEEEPVQKMGEQEEEPVQKMEEEEETVQQKEEEEEEPVQKMEEEEETVQQKEEEEEAVQAKSNGQGTKNNNVETKLKSSKGQGSKMKDSTLTEMEHGFGADFSHINIHTGTEAQAMSEQLGAQAFTSGNDVYFNQGKYDPTTKEGKHLLAHELTHTIQQKGKAEKDIQKSAITNQSEDLEAEKFTKIYPLEEAHDSMRVLKNGSQGFSVTKLQQGLTELGFALPKFGVDGIFGSETKNAVSSFQDTYDLKVDGVVGGQTMGALDDLHSGKGINQGGSCVASTPFGGTFFNLLPVPFFSTKSCSNITVTFEHKANIHGFQSCIQFHANVDNVGRTKKVIKTNDKFQKTTLKFKMKNATKHKLNFAIDSACQGLSITIKNGKLKRH